MLNILAQTNGTVMLLSGAGGGALLTGVIYKIANRQFNKVLDHVDNTDIHVNKKNGYATKEKADRLETELLTLRQETNENIKSIHARIDDIFMALSELKK